MTENYCSSACVRCPYLLQRGVLVEAAVFEIHLIITGRLDVVGVHLQKTPTNVSTSNLRHGQSRQVWSWCWGRVLTRSMVFLLFVSASCPEIKASHFSLSAAGSSGGHKTFLIVIMRIKNWVCVCRHEGLPEMARWICVPLGPLSQLWTIELAILVRWPM